MDAYIAFMPDPEVAAKFRVVMDKYNAVGDKMIALLERKMPELARQAEKDIDHMVGEVERQIDQQCSGSKSTTAPESSASVPTRSRSAKLSK
jgi:hypothetical protein